MVGKTLGHYEMIEPLGAGGMGEVYRARDTKLDRDVAIKVLPEDFAADQDRLARFEREAKLLASLNHSNIAAIHGLEDEGDQRFIVMEVVEGETLAERIARSGRIEVDEALEIARQIAEALEAAHENGVIHRDLKPANVIVTPEGKAKVLDFGLAKAYEADGSPSGVSPDLSHSPTMMAPTRTGVIMGTAGYMSPEQARGKSVDKRTDIWSFGCVVYEMLAGRRAFSGETVSDTMAAILKEEPQWNGLRADVPRLLRSLLQRCLQKDPHRRLHDIADARIDIVRTIEEPDAAGVVQPSRWGRVLPWAIAVVAVTAALTSSLRPSIDGDPPAGRPARFTLSLPPGLAVSNNAVAVSQDGSLLAVIGRQDGGPRTIWVRGIDEPILRPLEVTRGKLEVIDSSGTGGLAFSPDGNWITYANGYLEGRGLQRVEVNGRSVSPIGAGVNRGVAWLEDNTIVYPATPVSGLFRMPVGGGSPQPITGVGEEAPMHRWPQALPGQRILFTDGSPDSGSASWAIMSVALQGGEPQPVWQGGTYGRYVPTGHLVFGRDNTLFAVPLDLETMQTSGLEVAVIDDIEVASPTSGRAAFDFSSNGTLIYMPTPEPSMVQPVFVGMDGIETGELSLPAGRYGGPRFAPGDARTFVVSRGDAMGGWHVILNRAGRPEEQLAADASAASWYPDGKRLVLYRRLGAGAYELMTLDVGEVGGPRPLLAETRDGMGGRLCCFSLDGSALVYTRFTSDRGWGVHEYDLEADEHRELVDGSYYAALSPNGRTLAYTLRARGEVFVASYAPGEPLGPATTISVDGGSQPAWSADGLTLYYRRGTEMMAVDMGTDPESEPGGPKPLFDGPYALGYDVAPDGSGFIMLRLLDDPNPPPREPVVVLNWFEELKERVPPGGR